MNNTCLKDIQIEEPSLLERPQEFGGLRENCRVQFQMNAAPNALGIQHFAHGVPE